LPKKIWDKLSDAEKQEAEQSKEEASKKGEQHVEWTPAIERAMREIEDTPTRKITKQKLYEQAQKLNVKGRSKMNADELQEAIAQKTKAKQKQDRAKK
jgi:hypothetical protein